ncbi:MAG: bifunctional oligoribonuclease/PAP phosphatase NrnA [Candidatus Woesebacteria bacterium]|nr:bifunctional oligoribonuclease/PAP phosphatase NrnA [Candidatus Woesebacteria bacterium]
MNYEESLKILEEIKKAKKILINCHKNPDSDSVGSALAAAQFIKFLDKEVRIICPTKINSQLKFIENFETIEQGVDFNSVNYKDYDLFIVLDSSSWDFASKMEENNIPPIKLIVIDHHATNKRYGSINLVDKKLIAVSELLYSFFEDCGFEIDKKVASFLLVGIIGDSGVYRFPGTTAKTLEIAAELISKGVDQNEIIRNLYFSVDFEEFKFWGRVMDKMQYDREYNFVWVAISNEIYKEFGGRKNYKEDTATTFFQSINFSDFGIVMIEEEKGTLNVSLRSRTGLDVSQIAVELGGGGHRYASGGGIKGLQFNEAVEKVLGVARKYAKKTN